MLNTVSLRSGRVPRSVWFLLLVLLVAAAALWVVSRRNIPADLTLGGPLLELADEGPASRIDGFLLTKGGAQYRFELAPDGLWILRGGLVDDLDQSAVELFLSELLNSSGGRLLPGTEVDDRRYEFNGPQSLRLSVFTADGQRHTLAVGVINPVTGHYYASGMGRPGCFPISEVLRQRLASVPDALRLAVLMPPFDRTVIDQVELWYGQESHVLARHGSAWWLRQPTESLGSMGLAARSYHQQYQDRQLVIDGETWLLADPEKVSKLIYEASEIIVTEFPSAREGQQRIREWELQPPWRQVRLHGRSINPDSTEAAGDNLEIAFGPALSDRRVPALRRGNVLLTENEAITSLQGLPGDFLEVGAITAMVARGDTLKAWRENQLVLAGGRGAAPAVADGAQERPLVEGWHTVHPARDQRGDLRDLSYDGLVRNFIVNLDRLEVLRVLPLCRDRQILSDRERVVVEISGAGVETGGGPLRLEFGYLQPEKLPPGSPSLLPPADGLPATGMWRPDTGKLVQVPGHIVVTLRNQLTAQNSGDD